MSKKSLMSLSLDLDNKWSYLRTYGNPEWERFPSYLNLVCPRIVKFFKERDIKITFYIVGKDATIEENRAPIKSLSDAGHEIGNHSFFHEPWLHLYTEEEFNEDLRQSEEAIKDVTGVHTTSFRGPGYSLTSTTLRVLKKRGYHFDATAFPNVLNPLARAYLFATTKLTREERRKRKALFGSFSDALRPVKPYQWELDEGTLPELPVTTLPWFKVPIHFSYLIYLASFSEALSKLYLGFVIAMCKLTKTEPSLLLHPLDFMGAEDDEDLKAFPGMKLPVARKLELMDTFVGKLTKHFRPVTMSEHVDSIMQGQHLKSYVPKFASENSKTEFLTTTELRDLRHAFGQFATGVTVVTTKSEQGELIGVTANSFCSVSLEPPMVLWSVSKRARSRPAFDESEFFCVHILTEDQRELSDSFATRGADKFGGVDWHGGPGGVPMFDEFAARFQCRTSKRYPVGDHIVIIGEVIKFDKSEARPLVFHGGSYASAERRMQDRDATGADDLAAAGERRLKRG